MSTTQVSGTVPAGRRGRSPVLPPCVVKSMLSSWAHLLYSDTVRHDGTGYLYGLAVLDYCSIRSINLAEQRC
jgi:hypothetical protein